MKAFFPSKRIVRIDSDAKKIDKERLIDEIDSADIIVGTQMAITTYHEDI